MAGIRDLSDVHFIARDTTLRPTRAKTDIPATTVMTSDVSTNYDTLERSNTENKPAHLPIDFQKETENLRNKKVAIQRQSTLVSLVNDLNTYERQKKETSHAVQTSCDTETSTTPTQAKSCQTDTSQKITEQEIFPEILALLNQHRNESHKVENETTDNNQGLVSVDSAKINDETTYMQTVDGDGLLLDKNNNPFAYVKEDKHDVIFFENDKKVTVVSTDDGYIVKTIDNENGKVELESHYDNNSILKSTKFDNKTYEFEQNGEILSVTYHKDNGNTKYCRSGKMVETTVTPNGEETKTYDSTGKLVTTTIETGNYKVTLDANNNVTDCKMNYSKTLSATGDNILVASENDGRLKCYKYDPDIKEMVLSEDTLMQSIKKSFAEIEIDDNFISAKLSNNNGENKIEINYDSNSAKKKKIVYGKNILGLWEKNEKENKKNDLQQTWNGSLSKDKNDKTQFFLSLQYKNC